MRKLSLVICAVLAGTLIFTACLKGDKTDVAGKTYIYEKDGFYGDFTISINEGGSYSYYEGLASSYLGVGTWVLDGDILCLADSSSMGGRPPKNYFRVDGDSLIFIAENSTNFIYMDIPDGGKFFVRSEFK